MQTHTYDRSRSISPTAVTRIPAFDLSVDGIIAQGYGHASGSQKYPEGTINLQKIAFLRHGVDIRHCHSGTLNLDISPRVVRMRNPTFVLREVDWREGRIPENFFLAHAQIVTDGGTIDGFVYCPDPTTKTGSIDNPTHIQLVAPYIQGITYGSRLCVRLQSTEIEILNGDNNQIEPTINRGSF